MKSSFVLLAENISSIFLGGLAGFKTHASDWFVDKALGWPAQPPVNKIDLHHHFLPDFYVKAVEEHEPDLGGWTMPPWSPLSSRLIMKHLGVQTAILSTTAPGVVVLPEAADQAALARRVNEYAAALRDEDPLAFGFFATLPDPLLNGSLALAELAYALDVLRADGVTLFTSYAGCSPAANYSSPDCADGPHYLGSPALDPLWAELDRRNATVFVHPTHHRGMRMLNPRIPLPVVDYPHETTRAAVDMITHRTPLRFPSARVILSHAGGTLPYLLSRMATPLRRTPDFAASYYFGVNHDEAFRAFRAFYYDLALAASPQVLRLLLDVVPEDHIVYGSDFPFAPAPSYPAFLEDLEGFAGLSDAQRDGVNFANAHALVRRFAKQVGRHDPDAGARHAAAASSGSGASSGGGGGSSVGGPHEAGPSDEL